MADSSSNEERSREEAIAYFQRRAKERYASERDDNQATTNKDKPSQMSDVYDLLDADFDLAPEEQMPKERVYPLHIRSVEPGVTEKEPARRKLSCSIDIEETDEEGHSYQGIFHVLVFPNKDEIESDDRKERETAKMMLRNVRRFAHVFGVEVGGGKFDPNALVDARGKCAVYQRVRDDNKEIVPALKLPRVRD